MNNSEYFSLLSQYNSWMNDKLYRAAQQLTHAQLIEDRGAFFGSVLGTLNHIMVGDIVWLKRFAQHPRTFAELQHLEQFPQPTSLNQTLHHTLADWWHARQTLDQMIVSWTATLQEADLAQALDYKSRLGEPHRKRLGPLLLHFFNHQTHHRGQLTTLFHQQGVDVGMTDLVAILPEEF